MLLWKYVSQAILAPQSISSPSSAATTSTTLSHLAMANSNTTIYFGYGSNLWRQQMEQRCPHSEYKGVARLNDYKWLINERGYANVVEISRHRTETGDVSLPSAKAYEDEVWGLVYTLQPSDEAPLDRNEGVPVAYTKEWLVCDFWPVEDGEGPANLTAEPEQVDMLVYINREQVTPSAPKKEYIYRMNKGIDDAVDEGVPEKYVEKVMRKFIPEGGVEEDVVEVARKQAVEFEDEE